MGHQIYRDKEGWTMQDVERAEYEETIEALAKLYHNEKMRVTKILALFAIILTLLAFVVCLL